MKKDSKCKDCIHVERLNGAGGKNYWTCNYLLDTGKVRPCEAGDGCTVFETEGCTAGRPVGIYCGKEQA